MTFITASMNCLKFIITGTVLLSIMNCSTMSTNKRATDLSAITANKTYQLRVRSGNIGLDRIIYYDALAKFGEYLQINGDGSPGNYMEIVFKGSTRNGITWSADGYTNNMIYGNAWYTGDDSAWSSNGLPVSGMEITSDGIFSWQKSTMTVTMTDSNGKILWGATFNYKGSSEPSGLYVNAADAAARISIDRIIQQFEIDYIIIPESENHKVQNKMPDIALTIEGNGPDDPEDLAGNVPHPDEHTDIPPPEHGLITF